MNRHDVPPTTTPRFENVRSSEATARHPRLHAAAAGVALAFGLIGCGAPLEGDRAAAITTDGQDIRLVETLAIGEELGTDAYLFGSVTSAWVTDERVFIADAQVPAVRAFDRTGRHLFDMGRPGQGPGEFTNPAGLVVTEDGRIAVADLMNSRINFYGPDGEFVEDWPLRSPKAALGLALTYDGELLTESWDLDSGRLGMQVVGSDGPRGNHIFPPTLPLAPAGLEVGKGTTMVLPFAPGNVWTYSPAGDVVAGNGDAYELLIVRPDGAVESIEGRAAATPVTSAEATYRADLANAALRLLRPGSVIGAADIPTTKPFFSALFADRGGRLWVVRPGPGRPDDRCEDLQQLSVPRLALSTGAGSAYESPGKPGRLDEGLFDGRCVSDTVTFDLFDLVSGEFLAEIQAPEPGFRFPLFADEHTVAAAVPDESGTLRLKLYAIEVY
jgi:hypothetical protein